MRHNIADFKLPAAGDWREADDRDIGQRCAVSIDGSWWLYATLREVHRCGERSWISHYLVDEIVPAPPEVVSDNFRLCLVFDLHAYLDPKRRWMNGS